MSPAIRCLARQIWAFVTKTGKHSLAGSLSNQITPIDDSWLPPSCQPKHDPLFNGQLNRVLKLHGF